MTMKLLKKKAVCKKLRLLALKTKKGRKCIFVASQGTFSVA